MVFVKKSVNWIKISIIIFHFISSNTRIETFGGSISALRSYTTNNNSSEQIVTPYPPLTRPLDDLPPVQYAHPPKTPRETRVTTLKNGLRVASEQRFGQFCTIGGEFHS